MDTNNLPDYLASATASLPRGASRASSGKTPGKTLGSKTYIYKQETRTEGGGHRVLWMPLEIDAGPRSEDVVILGMGKTFGPTDRSNNYLYEPANYPDGSDAVHTFTIVQRVMDMYRRTITRMKYKKIQSLNWQWGTAPILVFPHAGHKNNAFYDRSSRTLAFYYYRDDANTQTFYNCQSLDVVAHETGHAILDSLKPEWMNPLAKPETHALHEAFADITTFFALFDHFDMCETVITQTKGNLRNKTFLPEQNSDDFGLGLSRTFGLEVLRNIDDNLHLSDVVAEPHSWSRILTGAIYDILVRIFESEMDVTRYDPAETLYRTAKHLMTVLILAIVDAPNENAVLRDVALAMMKIEPKAAYKNFMRHEFKRRGLLQDKFSPKPWDPEECLVECGCGTLNAARQPKLKEVLTDPLRPAINLFVQGRPTSLLMY